MPATKDEPLYETPEARALIGIWNWHVSSNLVIACQRVCEYINVSAEAGRHGIAPERFRAAIHVDDWPLLTRRTKAAMASGDAFVAEYRLQSLIHGTRWVRSTGRCFRDARGNLTQISGYLTKIELPRNLLVDGARGEQENELVSCLIHARDLAGELGHDMLRKLIEATLLEAGHRIAARLKGDGDDPI